MAEVPALEPAAAYSRLARIKLDETEFDGVLALVVDLARRTVGGAAEVSVTLVPADGPYTAAFTGPLALTLDAWQYEQDSGPCLEAARTTTTVPIRRMAGERRWPRWAARAAAAGVHGSVSIGLPLHEAVDGALNIYAAGPDVLDEEAVVRAQRFAAFADTAVANAHLYRSKLTLARHIKATMDDRAIIEQAKGVVMARRRCTLDEAFTIITRLARDADRPVSEICAGLVARAASP